MGLCWSEPPSVGPSHPTGPTPPVQRQSPIYPEKVVPTAPTYQQYATYNPNYTYAVRPQQEVYYQYPQQTYQQTYPQYGYQQYPPQQYPQQRQGMSTGAAVATGFVLGAIAENLLDPTE